MARVTLAMSCGEFDYAVPVAVKRLLPHLAEREAFVDMFLDEAFVASRISHPNVVAVRDVRRHRDEPILILEYLEGLTASRLIRELLARDGAMLPVASAARIVLDGLNGLAAAHALRSEIDGRLEGLVHRDVSPQNLFVCTNGHTKLIDFGITRVRGRLTQTQAGSIKGKFAYMAPEQIDGEYDQRVDVYAMGVVLFELLTSSRLFGGTDERKTLAAVMTHERPSVLDRLPSCPPELAEVVRIAIQRDPHARFGSADAMARALMESLARVDPRDARGALTSRVMEVARTELLELRGLIAANRASIPPGRMSRSTPRHDDTERQTLTSDAASYDPAVPTDEGESASSWSEPPSSALPSTSLRSSAPSATRSGSLPVAVPVFSAVSPSSTHWTGMVTSAVAIFALATAAAFWWLGCAVEPPPTITKVGPDEASEGEARCDPAAPVCGDGEACARGVDPRDWSVGRCVPIRALDREVTLPLRHPNGVRVTHASRDVSGSHAYLDTLYALDLVAEADAMQPRGVVVAVDDGVVIDVHAGCPEPTPGTDDPCGLGYGNHVRLRHDDGTHSFYAHLVNVRVRPGERVPMGATLGDEGWTGRAGSRHLHFAMQVRAPGGGWQSVPYRLRVDERSLDVASLRCSWEAPCEVWRDVVGTR